MQNDGENRILTYRIPTPAAPEGSRTGGREDMLGISYFIYRISGLESIDIMDDTPQNPIEYFRVKSTQTDSRTSIGNMTRAVDSLSRFVGGADLTFSSFDAAFLGEWVAHQFFEGYYANTVAYNISKIAALYNKAVSDGLASPNDNFTSVLSKVGKASSRFDGIDHLDTARRIRELYRKDYPEGSNLRLARDIVLFGILNGGMTLSRLATYRKDEYTGDDSHVRSIVGRYSKPRNKYLFPLGQGSSTPRKVMQMLEASVGSVLRTVGIRHAKLPDSILLDIWCDIAMDCGFSSSEIAGCIAGQKITNALTFCASPSPVSEERIGQVRAQVTEALTNNPVRWYAMHLRRHVDFTTLTDRLSEKDIVLDEIYYPMEEILRKTGRKKMFESRPVISWLIFYRARVTQLGRMFHEIGDLAWGYRYLRDVRSPYAVISGEEVREYQRAIGTLSPSTRMVSGDEVQFSSGDYLVVLGGPLHGRHGVFISEKKEKGEASGRVVFRISLAGGNNVNWEVNWDPQLVRKISEEQYNDLDAHLRKSLQG